MNFLKRWVPWLVAVVCLSYFFHKISVNDLQHIFAKANKSLVFCIVFGYFILTHFIDSISLKMIFKRPALALRESLAWRAESYPLMVLNYHAAQAGLAWIISDRHQYPFKTALKRIYLITGIDLGWIVCLSIVGIALAPQLALDSRLIAFVFSLGAFFGILGIIVLYKFRFKVIQEAKNFRSQVSSDAVNLIVLRFFMISCIVCGYNVFLMSWGATLPWTLVWLLNPLICLVWTLPLSPLGLGTTQALIVAFFSSHVTFTSPVAQTHFATVPVQDFLVTTSLAWSLMSQLIRSLVGFLVLTFSTQKIARIKKTQ